MAVPTKSSKLSKFDPNESIPPFHSAALEPIDALLSEVGIYSYAAFCALLLHHLFPDEWDVEFRDKCLHNILTHFKMPKQVYPMMEALCSGEATGEMELYLNVIRKEPRMVEGQMRIVQELVAFAVQEGVYDARMRTFVLSVSYRLNVAVSLVEMYEQSVVELLSHEMHEPTEDELKEIHKRQRNKKIKRYLMIGLATVGGGTIIGLTGGLAAPLVATGAAAVIGAGGAAALGSAAGIALIGSVIGVAGAGLTGYKMKKRVGEIEEFAFDVLTPGHELHTTIAISGFLTEETPDALYKPWRTLFNSREQYCLRYETAYLFELGQAINYLFSFAVSMAAQEALKYTVLSGLIAAIAWPATLVMVAGVIDNPWGVCLRRSAEVGKHLADVLCAREQGKRPVTLIGFSLGARVIYYCLREMSRRKNTEGIIENVIMLGTPVSANADDWRPLCRVVAGRIVNGYSAGDWLLKFLYRTSSASLRIAGLQPIQLTDRRMTNVDLSDVVSGHADYQHKMHTILKILGIRTTEDVHPMRKSRSFVPENWHAKPESSVVISTGIPWHYPGRSLRSNDLKRSHSDSDFMQLQSNMMSNFRTELTSLSLESVLSSSMRSISPASLLMRHQSRHDDVSPVSNSTLHPRANPTTSTNTLTTSSMEENETTSGIGTDSTWSEWPSSCFEDEDVGAVSSSLSDKMASTNISQR